MSFVTLKNKVKEKLSAITEIQEVKDYPNQDFGGYPSANVRTTGNESEYETTNENEELYVFMVTLFQETEHWGFEKSRDIIDGLCDTVRDAFDSDEFLTGITMPSNRIMLGIRPTVSIIQEVDAGKYVIADIELAIRVSKRVRTI